MAAPTYATDLVTITTAESTTGWSALGGGGAGLSASPDLAVQGTNCVDKQITSAEKGQVYDNGSTITPGAAEHFYIWIACTTPGLLDTQVNRGLTAVLGTTTSAYVKFHLTGLDTFELQEAFKCWPIRYVNTTKSTAPRRTLVGTPGANPQHFGGMMSTTASVKGANLGVDAIRRGSGYFVTAGDGTTPATLAGIAAVDLTNRYGVLQRAGGAYLLQGKVVIGRTSGGTPTAAHWVDSNVTVTIVDTGHSLTNFSQLVIDHASTVVDVDGLTFQALGTNNRGLFLIESAAPAVAMTGWSLLNIGASTLRSTTSAPSAKWIGSGLITANGADLSDASIASYSGASDTSAVYWNTSGSTDGKLDRTVFTKGAGTTHALRLGVLSPLTIDLVGTKFNGYNASDNQNDSAVLIDRVAGTVTFNLTEGADQPSVKSLGALTVFVVNPVATTITVKDVTTGGNVQNARVLVLASDGTGPLPYDDTVTITRLISTASVSHTAHGMANGEYIQIKGANQAEYNGIHAISNVSTNAYDFTVSGSPTTPATGTILATGVVVNALSNASGIATYTRSFGSDQPVVGRVRKSTASPLYKTARISGTINASTGFATTVQLVSDE